MNDQLSYAKVQRRPGRSTLRAIALEGCSEKAQVSIGRFGRILCIRSFLGLHHYIDAREEPSDC